MDKKTILTDALRAIFRMLGYIAFVCFCMFVFIKLAQLPMETLDWQLMVATAAVAVFICDVSYTAGKRDARAEHARKSNRE